MKIKKIISILLLTFLFTSCTGEQNSSNTTQNTNTSANTDYTLKTYRQITMNEAASIMKSEKDYIILDVRRPDEFSAGHIPNAINVPNEIIGTSEISELPDKEQLILVYCRSGRRSKEASQKLVDLGYTNIVEFGGILDWSGETVKE
jgi:rhodanese-related sulfurtransferase